MVCTLQHVPVRNLSIPDENENTQLLGKGTVEKIHDESECSVHCTAKTSLFDVCISKNPNQSRRGRPVQASFFPCQLLPISVLYQHLHPLHQRPHKIIFREARLEQGILLRRLDGFNKFPDIAYRYVIYVWRCQVHKSRVLKAKCAIEWLDLVDVWHHGFVVWMNEGDA